MTIIRILLLFLIVFVTAAIMYKLLEKRAAIMRASREGLSTSSPDYAKVTASIASAKINQQQMPIAILNSSEELMDVPINQFMIKASANSAYSNDYISDDMLMYVCSRGVRYLDFEVYYLKDESGTGAYNAYVGYSSDTSSVSPTIRNIENVTFQHLLQKALDYSFSAGGSACPNPDDPLFIKIRTKCNAVDLAKLMTLINDDILYCYNNGYSNYFYIDKNINNFITQTSTQTQTIDSKIHSIKPIIKNNKQSFKLSGRRLTNKTTLGDLRRKVVFIFTEDNTTTKLLAHAKDMPPTVFHNMTTAVDGDFAGLLGTSYLYINNSPPSPPIQRTVTTTMNADKFYEVYPDENVTGQANPDIYPIIQNYGYQIVQMQYYSPDSFLLVYETLFNNYSAGLVPVTYCMSFARLYGNAREMNLGIKSFMRLGGILI